MEKIGTRIRVERKKTGLTLRELAEKVGINPITLHRIETGKSSPSVALLSEIAQALNQSIVSFVQGIDRPLVHIKNKNQQTMSGPALKIKVVGPRKMITNNIVVTYGELKKGETIHPHTNPGIEFAYNMEGKCEFKLSAQSYFLEAGDSLSYNARVEHSVFALERLKFIAVYVKD
jgi:quercetin dioxygenase-like cupin family protein/DNA-binding Xre family transcriptional regulator